MESLDTVVEEIRRRRRRLGVSQAELAEEAGVSQSYVAKLESGVINPSYRNLDRILGSLDDLEEDEEVCVEEFMNRDVDRVSPDELVKRAVDMMKEGGYSQLPVVEDGVCVGSVTEKLIVSRLGERGLEGLEVGEIMGPAFPMVPGDTGRSEVVSLLRTREAVLVGERGRIAGIVTKADLL